MKIYIFGMIIILLLFSIPSDSIAQKKAGINSAAFLKVGVGAREVAMGSAVSTLSEEVNQMFWNPAGIAMKEKILQASFSYNKWIADLNHNSGAVSYNLKDVGTVGIGVVSFGVSDIPASRDPFLDLETSTSFNYMDLALQISFARYIMDNLALGFTAKYISESIDGINATAVAFDVGSIYSLGVLDGKIAARLSNIGSDIKYYDFGTPIPITFCIGVSVMPLNSDQNKALVCAELVKPMDYDQYYNIGFEYDLYDLVAIRAGYKLNYSGVEDDGRTVRNPIKSTIEGWSIGAGIHHIVSDYNIRIDYSFTDMEILKDVHRISVSVGL